MRQIINLTRIDFICVNLVDCTKHLIFVAVHHHFVKIADERREGRVAIVGVDARFHRERGEFSQLHSVRHAVVARSRHCTRDVVDVAQRFKSCFALRGGEQRSTSREPERLAVEHEQKAPRQFGERMEGVELDGNCAEPSVWGHGVITFGTQSWKVGRENLSLTKNEINT